MGSSLSDPGSSLWKEKILDDKNKNNVSNNLGILLDVYFHCTQTTCGRVYHQDDPRLRVNLIVIFHISLQTTCVGSSPNQSGIATT